MRMRVKVGDDGKRFSKRLRQQLSVNTYEERVRRAIDLVAQKADDITPEDTGQTRQSQRTEVETTGRTILGRVFYDPSVRTDDGNYMRALLIHELDSQQGRYRRGDWKFLETAVVQNKDEILRILRGEA